MATIPQLDNSSTAVIWLNNQWLMIGSGNATPSYITAQVGISDWSSRRDLPLGSVFGNCLGYNGSLVLVGFKNGAIQNASNTNFGNAFSFSASISPFTTSCNNFAWNGYMWVAVGSGTNTIGV